MKKLDLSMDGFFEENEPEEQQAEETAKPEEEQAEENEPKEEQVEETAKPEPEEEEQQAEEEENFFEKLNRSLGIDIDITDIEDDEKGLTKYIKQAGNKFKEMELENLFTKLPDVREYTQYRLNNGDPKAFFKETTSDIDYDSLSVDEENVGLQKKLVKEVLKQNDLYDESDIDEYIEDLEDKDKLFKKAQSAANKLKEQHKTKKQNLLKKQEEERIKQETEAKEQWEKINNTIKKGEFAGFQVPESDKTKFIKNLSSGNIEKKKSNLSLEKKLLIEYLIDNDFNISKLIKAKSSTSLSNKYRKTPSQRMGNSGTRINKAQDIKFEI